MKKVVLAVLAVMCFASISFAGGGLGLKLGGAQNDPKTLEELFDYYGGELTKGYGVFALEGFYEWAREKGKIGLRFGFDFYGDNELKVGYGKITETTYAIPLTLYYKWDKGIKAWSGYLGGGLTYINTEIEVGADEDSESKFFPHIVGGLEYRFTKVFALGFEGKYNIAAKVKKDGDVYSDRSGISGALVGRFYF